MNDSPVRTRIWDYGWLAFDEIQLTPSLSDAILLEKYVSSNAFRTAFLPSDKDESGIHGPFEADQIVASDYEPFAVESLDDYLKNLLFSAEWSTPASPEQYCDVLSQLRKSFAEGARCYVLRWDESSRHKHHDWGFVFTVFREFVYIGQRNDGIRRFIIGYD